MFRKFQVHFLAFRHFNLSHFLDKLFSIYRSSAGSGKTRTLAKAYLLLALRYRADYFKHILAVTFTNKATQEMKDRILAYLDDFANGRANELAEEIKKELELDDNTFQQYAQEAQAAILHKYAQFSISTIDAFFQKVIRSFTREAGLVGDYRLEIEQDAVLEEVIDNLIDELGANKELTDWVVEFAKENLENERAWDVRQSLLEFSNEIFREEFKDIEDQVIKTTGDRKFFNTLRATLWQQRNFFTNKVTGPAREAVAILSEWDPSDIHYGKGSGIYGFLEQFASEKKLKEIRPPGDRLPTYLTAENWPSKKCRDRRGLIAVAEQKLIPILRQLMEDYELNYKKSLSAEVALQNLYVFGLLSDISRKLREYKDENNLMLLADAPKFLNGVIQDSDTPFIYEKVGSFYRNYLIDEFQDTSAMQWKNFLPLLVNSLDQGYTSLVVGDVKQAIYRWRGGDLKLLQQEIEQHIGPARVSVKELSSNFRSALVVVDFNNKVFEKASAMVALETGQSIPKEAYHDITQKISRTEEGFVQVKFLQEEADVSWKDQALEEVPRYLEKLQEMGVPLKDIAFLVRKNEEGQEIVAHLLQYKNSGHAKPGCSYDVVSNESLRLDGAASVNLLLGAMRYLLNPDDAIARAQLGYEFAKLHEPERSLTDVFAVTNQVFFEGNLPDAFKKEKAALKKLPLFELTETLVDIFKIGNISGEIAYLLAFQNLVLEFYTREKNDLGAFLEWWEANKQKKSVQVSGDVDAAQILTVHKSKGLQFKYVIIPFCSWNLDHDSLRAPHLWVTAPEQPFADAGFMPVKYSSTLQQTYFAGYYETERTRSYLDNLNLLYVALTRAEAGLMVMAPHPDVRKKNVAQLLYNSLPKEDEKQWNEAHQEFNAGTWTTSSTPTRHDDSALGLPVYTSFRWRDKLVMRQSAKTFFEDTPSEQQEKISYGIYLHTVLSRIAYAQDIPDTLDRIVLEGLITHEQKEVLYEQLQELMRNDQIASWFSEAWDVRTEIPILMPGGAENRIDRLLIKDKKAVVIDFKTGEPAKADQQQVSEYMEILRQMNFTDISGHLLYIKKGEVISVPRGKPKAVRKIDDKQLGLGF
ncbi:UvrD-helicase domain-containing protein [Chryseolinea soli]|uniref:UvrD-helicase domain-containing protein n=1 Tax=Chryseolinea soli TaxID=2321403 RepID=UPI00135BE334|nr:UvrD-helicase domain-containing protein [Chryseolinea soli]